MRLPLHIGGVAALGMLVPACGAASLPVPPPPARPAAQAPLLGPARYLVINQMTVDQGEGGIDRVVVNGRRLALHGPEIAGVGPAEPEVEHGVKMPPWAAGPVRYVFWKGRQLFGAETFLGALRPIATLPADPQGSFDWIDGAGIRLAGGAVSAGPKGSAPGRTGVVAPVRAVAADARRALAVSMLGRTWLTVDGGASYRDVTADLGGADTSMEVRGDAIVVALGDGRERVVTATGAIVDGAPGRVGSPRAKPKTEDPDPFYDAAQTSPLDAAIQTGMPLGDGGVVIASRGFVGRLDTSTLHGTSAAPLDPGLRDARCAPVRSGGAVVLACVGMEHAAVVDLEGAPRTERTFDLAGASEADRFVSGEDALGFLGPCDGSPPHAPGLDAQQGEGEPYNLSRQQVPEICVRAGKDEWVEHRLPPDEARDLIAWIPRAGGGAVALLARPAPFLDDRDRVSVRGGLRVVRLARSEPPLWLSPYPYQRSDIVNDALRVLADDTISGWLSSATSSSSELAVTIDAGGHVHTHGLPPLVRQMARAGLLALAASEDGRFWETVDGGQRWAEVDPPPGAPREARPHMCSAAGCYVGGFLRLGWTGSPGARAMSLAPSSEGHARQYYRRQPPPPPHVRLACSPAGLPEGRRIADSGGIGYTPQPQPRSGAFVRIGTLGMAIVPWGGSPQMPLTGDIDIVSLTPLDPAGMLRRQSIPIPRLGLPPGAHRLYDLRIGYLLEPDGSLSTFATGHPDACNATFLEIAGISRPLGTCADDPAVGVNLGGRVVVVHTSWDGLNVSVADAPPAPSKVLGARERSFHLPVALHSIHRISNGAMARGFSIGVGSRGGAPVVVVLDATGEAALAPIDPERGTLGAEERLRPLSEAALGSSPACAPKSRAGDAEARVVLPFESAIALDPKSIPGMGPATGSGVAVIRWSRDRACLDAIELPVHDDRFEENPGPYEPHGVIRKIVARFDKKAQAGLVLVGPGTETRQRLSCTALLPGSGDTP